MISGVGVRHYYMRLGYALYSDDIEGAKGEFMIKTLSTPYYKYMMNASVLTAAAAAICAFIAAILLSIAAIK